MLRPSLPGALRTKVFFSTIAKLFYRYSTGSG